jgi:hypothetical protein
VADAVEPVGGEPGHEPDKSGDIDAAVALLYAP